MNLTERYQIALDHEGQMRDPAQQEVLHEFDRLLAQLNATPSWMGWLRKRRPDRMPKGIYLWGGVGRGKTWLMDLFFELLPEGEKERLHFHRFMRWVHDELSRVSGQPEPLSIIAKNLAKRIRILCLDEFNVIDIGDAVILAGLIKALLSEGIVLVTTSNQHPDDLYKSGIQRASFLPAIALLNQYTNVIELKGDCDYRCELLEQLTIYHYPLNREVQAALEQEFDRLATDPVDDKNEVDIMGRPMQYLRRAPGLIWFDFEALCGPPRSQHDYIEIARCHHSVFVTNIPILDDSREDRSRRFIFCVDEFYDRRVKMVVSAEVALEELYQGQRLQFEFERTISRLQEMQTSAYLGQSHRG